MSIDFTRRYSSPISFSPSNQMGNHIPGMLQSPGGKNDMQQIPAAPPSSPASDQIESPGNPNLCLPWGNQLPKTLLSPRPMNGRDSNQPTVSKAQPENSPTHFSNSDSNLSSFSPSNISPKHANQKPLETGKPHALTKLFFNCFKCCLKEDSTQTELHSIKKRSI